MGEIIAGILFGTRLRIEKTLREKRAFDENTAIDLEEAENNYKRVLKLMEDGGLIGRTSEGKIYMTEKGQKKQIKGWFGVL